MTELTPTFKGELQFRRYSDTSTQGQQVVFAVEDREALERFIGKEGKRFMAVLVEIGDDEQPVNDKQREPLGDLCWRSVQWCKDPEFLNWIADVAGLYGPASEETAANLVKQWCGVVSRKELDTNPEASRKFNQLIRGPFQKHLIARGIVR